MKLSHISAIIFDLGGVILNLHLQETIDSFTKIANLKQKEIIKYMNNEVFQQYEKGEISSKKFRLEVKKLFGVAIEDDIFDTAWNAMLLDIPKERLDILKVLQTKFKLYLLSNTNEIHSTLLNNIVKNVAGENRLDSFFDKVYYSYKVGMRKPDSEIFKLVLNENSLTPSTTLFIDDTLEHIKTANQLGLKTWHITNQKELALLVENG